MTTLKDEIDNLPACFCRSCHHFQRVNFNGYGNVTNRQGFCMLGQLEGSYHLYISSSVSKDCMGYIFSDEHAEITKAEVELNNDINDFLNSLEDKRTKNSKLAQPIKDAQIEFFKQNDHMWDSMGWISAMQNMRTIGDDYFRQANEEQYKNVYDMVSLRKTDYNKFLAQVSVEIHNRFCDCDCIGVKQGDD